MNPVTVVFATVCCAALAGQRTWIVDNLGRPGSHFTEIDEAVQAASPGDSILAKGTTRAYLPTTITTGIRVVGVPDANPYAAIGSIEIRDTPADQTTSVVNVRLFGVPAPISIRDCRGPVYLEAIEGRGFLGPDQHRIDNCAFVTIRDGDLASVDVPTEIVDSYVVLQTTRVFPSRTHPALTPSSFYPIAMRIVRSRLTLVDSVVQGGPAVFVLDAWGSCRLRGSPTAAFDAIDSDILVAGTSTVSAGGRVWAGLCYASAVPAVTTTGGTLRIDPRATFDLSLGHGSATVTFDRMAATLAGDATRGASMPLTVYGARNGVVTTVTALPMSIPLQLPGLGALWLDPANFWFLVDSGTLNSAGKRTVSLPVDSKVPPNLVIMFQSLEANADGFRLSIPSMTAVR